jgi:hypothetical protein
MWFRLIRTDQTDLNCISYAFNMPATTSMAGGESSPRERELSENRKKALWDMIKTREMADEQILGHRFRIGWNRKTTQFTQAELAKVRASLKRTADYEELSRRGILTIPRV